MDNKKIITLSLCGTLVLGASACAGQQDLFDDTPSNVITDTAEIPATEQTETLDTTEIPDATQETETLSELAELSESELHALFESVYLESMESVKENPPKNKETQIAYEFNQLEAECEQGKKLPSDYKVQYREWRENYKLSDLSILFTDVMQTKYVTSSAYTYGDIYGESKLSSLVAGEAVQVTGIGFDKASGWLRIETDIGTVAYIRDSDVSDEVVIENLFTSVDEVRYATDADKVICYDGVDLESKSRSLSRVTEDTEVKVVGIGYGEAAGWLKIEIWFGVNPLGRPRTILTYYIRDEYLSETKTSSNQSGNSGGQSDSGGQSGNTGSQGQSSNNGGSSGNTGTSGSGGQQNGGSNSGGDQGSNNSGGNTGSSSSGDTYRDTGLTLEEIARLPDEEKIALGFNQLSNGAWVDAGGNKLPSLGIEDPTGLYGSDPNINWNP